MCLSSLQSFCDSSSKMILIVASLFLLLTNVSYEANILAIVPTPSYSHQVAFSHLWRELSLRGHQVTLITTDPVRDPKLTNLTEIDVQWTYKLVTGVGLGSQFDYSMWNLHATLDDIFLPVAEAQLTHREIQSLIHSQKEFDVVFVELYHPEFLAFAEIFNCPKIGFFSLDATALAHSFMGNPINPVLYPDIGATFHHPLNFKERIVSTLYTAYNLFRYSYISLDSRTRLVKKYFNISRTVPEMISDVDMMFLNVNPILQRIRLLGPSTITIGSDRGAPHRPLSKELAEFLDSAVNGFVYFSLGNNLKSKYLPKDTLQSITEAFRELPFKVLWKFETETLPNLPENVKLIKWAPQQSVLSHPNIKVFVTHGGLQSLEEAVYGEVPSVVIPFWADQFQNAKIMEAKGVTVIVNRIPSVDKIQFKSAIMEVATNPKYRSGVQKLKQLALDFPMTGLEKAIWWTEYVIRNKGAKHLRNPAVDIPLYQYFLIDVIGFLILTVTVIFILLHLALRKIYWYLRLLHIINLKKLE